MLVVTMRVNFSKLYQLWEIVCSLDILCATLRVSTWLALRQLMKLTHINYVSLRLNFLALRNLSRYGSSHSGFMTPWLCSLTMTLNFASPSSCSSEQSLGNLSEPLFTQCISSLFNDLRSFIYLLDKLYIKRLNYLQKILIN